MSDLPEEAVQAATRALVDHYGSPGTSSYQIATIALEAAAPVLAAQARADERRKVAEEIAAALLAVDPVEWALTGQHAGHDAARLAPR
jgi:hypothetical protein